MAFAFAMSVDAVSLQTVLLLVVIGYRGIYRKRIYSELIPIPVSYL